MKNIALILTLIGVMLFSVGCTKSPETPVKSIDNNTSVVINSIDKNTTNTNSTDIVTITTKDSNQSISNNGCIIATDSNQSNSNEKTIIIPMDNIVVTTDAKNPIDTLISKIKNKKLTSSEERKVYTSFNSVNNTYPITINGVKIESYDRTLIYDHINGRNLTACTRTKDVTMTSNNKTKKFRVCQTTNYDWIVK